MKGLVDISGEWLGQPFLQITSAAKNSKYFSVCWGDGTLTHYDYFQAALDFAAMEKEIYVIFQAGASKRKGVFSRGCIHGCVGYVTKDAAEKIAAVVEKHFRDALNLMVEAGITKASLGKDFELRDAVFRAFMAKRGAKTV